MRYYLAATCYGFV